MRKRDPEGHYAALSVSPGCSSQEIQLAYRLLKQAYREGRQSLEIGKIRNAYAVLGNRKTRAAYDRGKSWRAVAGGRRVRLDSVPLLIVLLIVFAAVMYFLFGSTLQSRAEFAVGDRLIWKASELPLGDVVAFEADHVFSSEISAPAYQVAADGKEPAWYPARDLKRHCKRAG